MLLLANLDHRSSVVLQGAVKNQIGILRMRNRRCLANLIDIVTHTGDASAVADHRSFRGNTKCDSAIGALFGDLSQLFLPWALD